MRGKCSTVLLIFISLAALIYTLSVNTYAQTVNATDNITINVTIKPKTIVDINPTSLTFTGDGTGLEPGQVGEQKQIQIENLGSVNITYIWFNNSYPSENPFGTGNVSKYDSGNWVVVKKYTDPDSAFAFPNRVEYVQNPNYPLIYLTLNHEGDAYGRFRNGSSEYFWELDNSTTGGYCNTTINFWIGDSPHTQSETGDIDLTDNTPVQLQNAGAGYEKWSYGAVNINGMQLCVAAYYDCTKVMFYKWNKDAPGADSCSNAKYFLEGATDGNLVPGASTYANVTVYVPYGVPYSTEGITGRLTVIVSSE